MGGLSIGHWIVLLIIVLIIFGTKRLTSGLGELGKGVREFKKGVNGELDDTKAPQARTDDTTPPANTPGNDDTAPR